jgi:hypothetical protein
MDVGVGGQNVFIAYAITVIQKAGSPFHGKYEPAIR